MIFCFETRSCSVTQAGVQRCDLSSLYPQPPRPKQSSYPSPLSIWDYKHAQLISKYFVEKRSHYIAQAGLNSWSQVILLPQHFGRPRQADHLRSGVRDQPGQHGKTPSLLKIQNYPSVMAHACNPSYSGG
uniref:cDNA FLJ26722 fis, clone PNC04936 n=1 Tax=Homo sapiens TaxID=9606 RepID=Q6ZP15_HUMAN|nr:unnamed protein product [Homo sapiens]